jgi:hypothetical protein
MQYVSVGGYLIMSMSKLLDSKSLKDLEAAMAYSVYTGQDSSQALSKYRSRALLPSQPMNPANFPFKAFSSSTLIVMWH